jgi:hypothetical protein
MRFVVPEMEGTLIVSVPSLVVAEANIVGNVCPPSVDNKMFTCWQLTEPVLVLFTFQVTVAVPPDGQVILVLGDDTVNGPAVLVTVTTTSVKAVCPTETGAEELKTWLSLTVNLKFKVLETELRASMLAPASPPGNGPVTFAPARMVESFGNSLVEVVVGLKDNQLGPVDLVGEATLPVPEVVELSFCSQQ